MIEIEYSALNTPSWVDMRLNKLTKWKFLAPYSWVLKTEYAEENSLYIYIYIYIYI